MNKNVPVETKSHLVWNGVAKRLQPSTNSTSDLKPLIAKQYQGRCHCGKVSFALTPSDKEATIIDCNCSICVMKGYLHVTVPKERIIMAPDAMDNMTTYTFNTGVAQHTFCKTCGVEPIYVPRSNPECYSVNVRCLVDFDVTDAYIELLDGNFTGRLNIES